MQGGLVRKLSVRPSAKRVQCDKKEERSVEIFTLYERSFSLVFWEKSVGWRPLQPEIFWSIGPRWSEIADF